MDRHPFHQETGVECSHCDLPRGAYYQTQDGLVLEDHSGGFRIKPLRHTEWPSPLEGSVELIKQFVAALGLTEHGAGIEPQHRVHVVAVSAGCFGKRHSGSQAGPDREVAA